VTGRAGNRVSDRIIERVIRRWVLGVFSPAREKPNSKFVGWLDGLPCAAFYLTINSSRTLTAPWAPPQRGGALVNWLPSLVRRGGRVVVVRNQPGGTLVLCTGKKAATPLPHSKAPAALGSIAGDPP
jgi:hypothetical protein